MKHLTFIFLISNIIFTQNNFFLRQIEEKEVAKSKKLVATDNLDNYYFLNRSEISINNKVFYSNFSLGDITKIDVFNPLKIKLWYSDFSTLIVLDNNLNEILRTDFTLLYPDFEITEISSSNENIIWIFDQNNMMVKKYDFVKNKFVNSVQVQINENVLDMKSDYNFLWLITKNWFYKINYNGSILMKKSIDNLEKIHFYKNDILLYGNKNLFYFDTDDLSFEKIKWIKNISKDFFVINETLYIYVEDNLTKFLISNK